MPTTLKILGWKATGLRCPDHEIRLHDQNDHVAPITLIQMPNGTGKTTTLSLIRAALAGQPAGGEWTREVVRSFRKLDPVSSEGSFTLHLLHNNKRVTFEMMFDFDTGADPRYTTTFQSGGMEPDHKPPSDMRQFLRPEFVNFFVFDGELANNLLDRQKTQAGRAIKNLFQLGLVGEVSARLDQHWEDSTANRTAKKDKGLTQRRNRVNDCKSYLDKRKAGCLHAETQLQEALRDLEGQKTRFAAALDAKDQLRESLEKAKLDVAQARAGMEELRTQALSASREPQALSAVFAQNMVSLKESLDRVQLPENTAREFFVELANESECVCGRPLDAETSAYILQKANRFLGSSEVSLLNQMKTEITEYVGAAHEEHEHAFSGLLVTLTDAIRCLGEAEAERDFVQSGGIQDDPELEAAQEKIRRLESDIPRLTAEVDRYHEPRDSTLDEKKIYSIAELERRHADAEKKLAEITETVKLRKKRDVLRSLLKHAEGVAQEQIQAEIKQRTNATIQELLPDNAIRVSEIKSSIVLRDQEAGSMGENLSVGYAFLATLFGRDSQVRLPFIVDSPAGALDYPTRIKVAGLIPRLSEQYLAFVISTEREGFLEALERVAPDGVNYFTLFRRGNQGLDSRAQAEADGVVSADGWCVPGRPFFQQFHVDAETTPNGL